MGGGNFGRDPKYKKVVDALFPKQHDAPINAHNIPNLLHYASMTPNKLPKIGRYLEKRARADLAKKRFAAVEVTMTAFNELIKACHKDIAFFAPHVIDLMTLLLSDPRPELKCTATRTFMVFAESQHATSRYQLDNYLQYFLEMATAQSDKHETDEWNMLRIHGLRGIHAYITMIDDLEDFIQTFVIGPQDSAPFMPAPSHATIMLAHEIPAKSDESAPARSLSLDRPIFPESERISPRGESSKQDNKNQLYVLPVVLERIRESTGSKNEGEYPPIESLDAHLNNDWKEASVSALAALQLKDLAQRLNNITIRPLFSGLLCYLDRKGLWCPNSFAEYCLRVVATGMQRQHYHILATLVLNHLESMPAGADHSVRSGTVKSLRTLIDTRSYSGPIVEVLSALLRQLIQTANLNFAINTESGVKQLQEDYLDCISIVMRSVSDSFQCLEGLSYMVDRYQDYNSPDEVAARRLLAQALTRVADQLKPLPATKSIPIGLTESLLRSINDTDWQVRLNMQKVMQKLFSVEGYLERISSQLNASNNTANAKSNNRLSPKGGEVKKTGSIAEPLRGSSIFNSHEEITIVARVDEWHLALYQHLVAGDNQPDNLKSVIDCLEELLRGFGKNEIGFLVPLLFQLQEVASRETEDDKEEAKNGAEALPSQLKRSLHACVAVGLLLISREFDCQKLFSYIEEVLAERKKNGQLCHYILIEGNTWKVKKPVYKSRSKQVKAVTALFSKESILENLSQTPSFKTGENALDGKTLAKMVLRKFPVSSLKSKSNIMEDIAANGTRRRARTRHAIKQVETTESFEVSKWGVSDFVSDIGARPVESSTSDSTIFNITSYVNTIETLRKNHELYLNAITTLNNTSQQQNENESFSLLKSVLNMDFPAYATAV